MPEVKGSITWMDAKTGRPIDIRTLGGGWPKLYEVFTRKAEHAKMVFQKWKNDHQSTGKSKVTSKI